MYVIVGLGNPGKKYDGTRHNVGFDVVDYLSAKLDIPVNKIKYKALVGEGRVGTQKVLLVKPQTYMNLSGESVMQIMSYYDLPVDNLIVVYDDIDTEAGKLRIRKKGSAGTHNGMRNIIYLLRDDSFPRVRIGIGRPENGRDLADYVIGRFSKEEQKSMLPVLKNAGDAIVAMISDGVDLAMNRFNG